SEDVVPKSVYTQTLNELHSTQTALVDARAENSEFRREIERLNEKLKKLQELLKKSRKVDPLEKYLAESANERRRILEILQKELKIDFPDLKVVISQESDALRFEGDGLFRSGAS